MSENTEMKNYEQENKKLKAELTLLRSKLNKLEKDNSVLKEEKSKMILGRLEVEDEIKKKLLIKEKELKIMENGRKAFKANPLESNYAISPKFILENTLDLSNLQTDSFLKNLRFFKDFFFDDFYSITDAKAVEIVEFFEKQSQKEFLDAFEIFSCKKHVFTKFCNTIFEDNSFVKIKIKILTEIFPEWIIELFESSLKGFINKNRSILVEFFANFAEKCPFHLKSVLDKETFNSFLIIENNPSVFKLIFYIVKHRIVYYFDHTNIHLVPKQFVCQFFNISETEYIDLNLKSIG